MYGMKESCLLTGMNYETLKFYCNEGLVPNVKRDDHNRRMFDDHDIAWIKSLSCLKNCGMSIEEMKLYISLCLQGETSIPERKEILAAKRKELLARIDALQSSIEYIDHKQRFYDDVLCGKIPYFSNILPNDE